MRPEKNVQGEQDCLTPPNVPSSAAGAVCYSTFFNITSRNILICLVLLSRFKIPFFQPNTNTCIFSYPLGVSPFE